MEEIMSTENSTIANLHNWIQSGFYTADEVKVMLIDIIDESDDQDVLHQFIDDQFVQRDKEQTTWKDPTDCDRLDQAFAIISKAGVVVLQNAGNTMSDGFEEVGKVLKPHPKGTFKGYCFYHNQDLERVIETGELLLAFSDLKGNAEGKQNIAEIVTNALQEVGLGYEWSGNLNERIKIPNLKWKRRS
jgi:hypothetical protein